MSCMDRTNCEVSSLSDDQLSADSAEESDGTNRFIDDDQKSSSINDVAWQKNCKAGLSRKFSGKKERPSSIFEKRPSSFKKNKKAAKELLKSLSQMNIKTTLSVDNKSTNVVDSVFGDNTGDNLPEIWRTQTIDTPREDNVVYCV